MNTLRTKTIVGRLVCGGSRILSCPRLPVRLTCRLYVCTMFWCGEKSPKQTGQPNSFVKRTACVSSPAPVLASLVRTVSGRPGVETSTAGGLCVYVYVTSPVLLYVVVGTSPGSRFGGVNKSGTNSRSQATVACLRRMHLSPVFFATTRPR